MRDQISSRKYAIIIFVFVMILCHISSTVAKSKKPIETPTKPEEQNRDFLSGNKMQGGILIRVPQKQFGTIISLFMELVTKDEKEQMKEISIPETFEYDPEGSKFYIKLDNVECKNLTFELADFTLGIEEYSSQQVLVLTFPIISNWDFVADYVINLILLKRKDTIEVNVDNLELKVLIDLKTNELGQLVFQVPTVQLNLSEVEFDFNKWIMNYLAGVIFKYAKRFTNSLMETLVIPLLNVSLTPMVSDLLSNYTYVFQELEFMGVTEQFSINYEVLQEPNIAEDYVDVVINGELRRQFQECSIKPKSIKVEDDSKYIQIVISDQVLGCAIEALETSAFNQYELSSESLSLLLGTSMNFTTDTFSELIPKLTESYPHQNVTLDLSLSGTKLLPTDDSDDTILISTNLKYGLKVESSERVILADDVNLIGKLDIGLKNNQSHLFIDPQIKELQLNFSKDPQLEINKLSIFTNEYSEMLQSLNMTLPYIERFTNTFILTEEIPLILWKGKPPKFKLQYKDEQITFKIDIRRGLVLDFFDILI